MTLWKWDRVDCDCAVFTIEVGDTDLPIRQDVKSAAARAEKKLFSESVMPDLLTTDVHVEQVPQEPEVNRYHRI